MDNTADSMGSLCWKLSSLIVILLGTRPQPAQAVFPGLPSNPGSLTTPLRLYYVGENLTLHCYKNTAFDGEVQFLRGNDVISSEYVNRSSDTYARLDKPVTSDDPSEADFICRDSVAPIIGKNGPIYTDYAPRNATNFEMRWYNKSVLSMKWNFGSDSFAFKNTHSNVILISAQYRRDQNSWQFCSESNSTTCIVNSFFSGSSTVSVRVNVTNVKRNESLVSVLPGLPVRFHAKPRPVNVKKVTVLTSRSVKLEIESDWGRLAYKITYCRTNTPSECSVVVTNQTESKAIEVSGLRPNEKYTFSVQSQFEFCDGIYSDPEPHQPKHDVTMLEDAPTSAPEVTPGSFHLDLTSCSPTQSSAATLYIYFQEVAKEHQNGRIRNYTAQVITEMGRKSVSVSEGGPRTLKLDHLSCHKGHNVSVYASTVIGHSPETLLVVPPWNEDLHKKVEDLDLMLKMEGGSVTAEWKSDIDTDGLSLLVFFCHSATEAWQCQETIQFENVSDDRASSDSHRLLDTASAGMLFGMAAVTSKGMTSGIVFSDCIYDPNKKVVDVPSSVSTRSQVDYILVTWKGPPRCSASQRFIVFSYQIEVCEIAQSTCQYYQVDGTVKSEELRKPMVRANTRYNVRVRANTSSGLTSYSTPVTDQLLTPSHEGLNTGQIVGVASGVLIVCIILGMVVFCYLRDKLDRMKRLFHPNLGTKSLPEVWPIRRTSTPDNTHGTSSHSSDTTSVQSTYSLIAQNSDDSGYNQDSPPASPMSDTQPLTKEETMPATTVHATDPVHEDSFSNPAMTISNPLQDVSYSTSGDENIAPYILATAVPSDNSVSQPMPGAAPLGNQQMVYFVKCDPPTLPSGIASPAVPLASLPSCSKPGYVQLGVASEQRAESGDFDLDGISLHSEEAHYTVTKVHDPSCVGQAQDPSHSQTPAKSYVMLSNADERSDPMLDGLNKESLDNQSLSGDFSDDDSLSSVDADDEPGSGTTEDPLRSVSGVQTPVNMSPAVGIQSYVDVSPAVGIQSCVDVSPAVGIQSYVDVSPANGTQADNKQADDRHDAVPAELHHQEAKAERSTHGYVSYPQLSQTVHLEQAGGDDVTHPVLEELSEDSDCLHEARTGLHLGYLPLPDEKQGPQLTQGLSRDQEEEELESESSEQAEQGVEESSDLQMPSELPTVTSGSGYVTLSSLPGTAVPAGDCPSPCSAAGTEDGDAGSSDDDTSPESIDDEEDDRDGIGDTCIETNIDESCFINSDGSSTTSTGSNTEGTAQTGSKSNGYVSWRSVPNHDNNDQIIDSGNKANTTKGTPHFLRMDSGFVSPQAEKSSSPVWPDTSPGEHPQRLLHSSGSGCR